MKRYSIKVVLHILLIGMLSVAIYIGCSKELWFSSLALLVILVSVAINLYRMQMKHIGMMLRLIESIRFNDMAQTFPTGVKNRMMRKLAEKLSDVLKDIRGEILAGEIKHQYYENLLNKVDTAVLVTETNGDVEWMNQAAILLLGQRRHIPDLFMTSPPRDTQVIRFEKDGGIREMAASSTFFSAQGRERLLISLKDIHSVLERNEMEAWQKLIRVLTHEIMNSITPIISLSETLSERQMPPEINEKEYGIMLQAMQTIHRRSKGLLEFVENYRRLTRLPAPVYSKVSVNELFSDLHKLFPGNEIKMEKAEPDLLITIDRAQIEQVFINLLKNAIEACNKRENPVIRVNVSRGISFKQLIFTVRDNGAGILPEVLDKIFVPFFTTKTSGSGIGLSLCKQIVNQHGGTIRVSSETGEGSCFTVTLPVVK